MNKKIFNICQLQPLLDYDFNDCTRYKKITQKKDIYSAWKLLLMIVVIAASVSVKIRQSSVLSFCPESACR